MTFFRCFILLLLVAGCAKTPAERGHKRILIIGDSLTAGYGLDPSQAFPVVLEKLIRDKGYPGVTFTADGASGATTESGLERLKAYLEPPAGVPSPKYDILLLELGGNDALRGMDLEVTRKNLSAIIQEAQEKGLTVLLAGMKMPPLQGLDYSGQFRKLFPEVAEEKKAALIPYLLEGVDDKPSLKLDEVHPNEKGQAVIAETVFKYLEPLL